MQKLSMRTISRLSLLTLVSLCVIAAPAASAQDDEIEELEEEVDELEEDLDDEDDEEEVDESDEDDEEESDEDEEDDAPRKTRDSALSDDEEELEGDFDAVRAKDRAPREGTPLIAKKLYSMKNRIEFTGMFDYSLNNKYVEHIGGHASVSYHILDYLAIEGFGGYFVGSETNIASEVRQAGSSSANLRSGQTELCSETTVNGATVVCEPQLPDLWQTTWLAGASVQWAPIYGKLSIVSEYDLNFQFYLMGGATAEGRRKKLNDGTFNTENAIRVSGNYGIGLRLIPFNFMALRLELKNYTGINPAVPERGAAGGDPCPDGYGLQVGAEAKCFSDWTHNSMLQVGVSFLL